jgi:AcrR family transcriptional regulator
MATTNDIAIREPAQARSRETMDRILETLEELLREKPFDRITMIELAQRSGAGTSSIYARFRDKQALILGLHARLREQVLECLERLADPQRWAGEPVERIVAGIVPPCVKFYRQHGALIRAALYVDDAEMRERQASVLRFAAGKFSALLPTTSARQARAVNAAVDFSVRLLASVMYAALMFGDVEIGRRRTSDREITRYLVRTITATLKEALSVR